MSTSRNPDQSQPEVQQEPPPDPIAASATLWDLEADPSALQEAAADLRERALRLVSAQTTVDEAANSLTTNGYWSGDAADAYQSHRVTVTRDLGGLAGLIGEAAGALEEIAWILADGQRYLDEQFASVASIPHPRSGHDIRFEPADPDQAAQVRAAVTAAEEIRSNVDESLVLRESRLVGIGRDVGVIEDAWQPRTINVMNLNVGQGHGNEPWLASRRDGVTAQDGTDPGDLDEIADVIAGQDADVVTLQEVFRHNANDELLDENNLETLLEERTGDDWEIHFNEASTKVQFDDEVFEPTLNPLDAFVPDATVAPFGNAVAVREGDLISGSEEVGGAHKLDTEGSTVRVPDDYPARDALPDEVEDDEGRSASVVEVALRGDD